MGLTSAMYTGLTGLNANQTRIETIGHNIANVNTNAYKGSRALFQTQFSKTLSMGTPPGVSSGGTNPMQIGLGTLVGTIQRTTAAGSLETTGLAGDLAVEGSGYFVVRDPNGGVHYTRDGAFSLNASHELVNANGYRVTGYGVDSNFNIVPGIIQDLSVPLGMESIARASTNVVIDGDLSAAETISSAGSETTSQAFVDGAGGAATAATALADLRSATAAGVVLFNAGDTITVSGVTMGDRELPARQFIIGADGNTLGDFASWLQTAFGIQDVDGLAGNPGVAVENGALIVRSNAGEPLAIEISNSDMRSSNLGSPLPFQFTQTAKAAGTGVFTSFTVYDSLGAPVPVQVTFTLESTPDSGPVWRYFLESGEEDAAARALGTGTISFDPEGNFVSATGTQVLLDRSNTGALTPLQFDLDFSTVNGLSTQTSNVIMAEQDGYPPGSLVTYAVGTDGIIQGTFTNGLTHPLGQVVLATFANDAGLVAEAENLFVAGANSGPAVIKAPLELGAGTIRGGALEMSNVDLSREFIGLITSSTAFQAASRVISTSNDMLDQLLMTLR